MIEISEIKSRETLKQWLDERPQNTDAEKKALRLFCVWLALRCALRVFPLILNSWHQQRAILMIPVLRCLLEVGVVRKFSTSKFEKLSPIHRDPYSSAAATAAATAKAAASAASRAAASTTVVAAVDAIATAASRAAAAVSAYVEEDRLNGVTSNIPPKVSWKSVRNDCELFDDTSGQDLVAVWDGENLFAEEWKTGRDWMLTQYDDAGELPGRSTPEGVDYRFWVDWYDEAMAGKHLSWDMQHEITLIEDDVWKGDPSVLMDRINGIRNRYDLEDRKANTPIGLDVKFDPQKKRLGAFPSQDADLSQIIKDVRGSLRRFVARMKKKSEKDNFARSLLGRFEEPIEYLRKDLSKYSDVPQRVYEITQSTIHELADIACSEHVDSDPMLNTLFRDLTKAGDDICGLASDVRDSVRKRSDIQFERVKAEQVEQMLLYAQGLQLDSHGLLKVMTTAAIVTISDEKASDDAKKDAWYFMQAVLPRAGLEMQRALEESDDPDLYKKVVKRAKEISTLDKGADAVQEAVAEFGPWFADMARFLSGFG